MAGSHTALVLGGGGARAAYQAGVLQYVARHFPNAGFPIMTGVSAGAINVSHLASREGAWNAKAAGELTELWREVRTENIFRVESSFFLKNVAQWGMRLISGGRGSSLSTRGLVDTSPLRGFLRDNLHTVGGVLRGIEKNVAEGDLRAAALMTTNYSNGRSVTWVQGETLANWERPYRTSRHTALGVDHVMASASLPLFFPAVQIRHAWYGDGGIRQIAPLSPAIHLGARRIVTVSTRYEPTQEEAEHDIIRGYPSPAHIGGVLMGSIFLDTLHRDVENLERINRLLDRVPGREMDGMRPIDLLVLRPSRDLAALSTQYEPELPNLFRYLLRGLGTQDTESPEWLSMLMFHPDYIRRLLRLGEEDAAERHDEIAEFFSPETRKASGWWSNQ